MIRPVRDARAALSEMAIHAQNGSCAVEYIGSLSKAVGLALGAVENEERARRKGPPIGFDLGALTEMQDWALIQSLLNLLEDQARLCAGLFEKLEVMPGQVEKAIGHG